MDIICPNRFSTVFLSCKYIFYTLKQTVVYITECTFYNYLQHSFGLPTEKQHTFLNEQIIKRNKTFVYTVIQPSREALVELLDLDNRLCVRVERASCVYCL